TSAMDLRPPRSAPGYLACEPVTFAGSPRAAPSRDAPPGFEPRPLWPPSFRAATSSVDTCAAARDQLARRSAPLPPAASAASHCLAYLWSLVSDAHRSRLRGGSGPSNSPPACSWENAPPDPGSAQRPVPPPGPRPSASSGGG